MESYVYYIGFFGHHGVSGVSFRCCNPRDMRPYKNLANEKSQTPAPPLYELDETGSYTLRSILERHSAHRVSLSYLYDYSYDYTPQTSRLIRNTLYLRTGQPFSFTCNSNTIYWFRSTYSAEVSFHYCNTSNSAQFQRDCFNRSEFTPLFAISRKNRTNYREISYLSEGAAALSKELHFSLPFFPNSLSSVFVRLPVLSVKTSFSGAFFCRVKITQFNQSTYFDSDLVNVKAFGMLQIFLTQLMHFGTVYVCCCEFCFACSAHLSPETFLDGH